MCNSAWEKVHRTVLGLRNNSLIFANCSHSNPAKSSIKDVQFSLGKGAQDSTWPAQQQSHFCKLQPLKSREILNKRCAIQPGKRCTGQYLACATAVSFLQIAATQIPRNPQ